MASSATASSRAETVVNGLRQRIFDGHYPPGSALRELTLARDFAVSQATIREALQRLEHTGLVTRTLNVGSTVTRLTPKDIRERVELRAALETWAATLASARMGEPEYTELTRRLQAMEEVVSTNSYYEAAQADLNFHRYIWQCSGHDALCRHLELVTIPLFAFISIVRSQGLQRLQTVVEAHDPLIQALRSRDDNRIRSVFEHAAVNPYLSFLTGEPELPVMSAFGLLTVTRSA